jgi:hypothetical protein
VLTSPVLRRCAGGSGPAGALLLMQECDGSKRQLFSFAAFVPPPPPPPPSPPPVPFPPPIPASLQGLILPPAEFIVSVAGAFSLLPRGPLPACHLCCHAACCLPRRHAYSLPACHLPACRLFRNDLFLSPWYLAACDWAAEVPHPSQCHIPRATHAPQATQTSASMSATAWHQMDRTVCVCGVGWVVGEG